MTSVGEVAKVITDENVLEILPRFYGLSSREAKEVAAALMPEPSPPRREVVTLVPVAAPAPKPQPRLVSAPELELAPRQPAAAPELVPAPEPAESAPVSASRLPPREEVQPLTATLRRVHYTVTKRWLDKLQAAKDALSHSIPDGDAEKVLEAALDALLEKEAKRKGLLVKNPRQPRTATTRIGTPAPESSVPTLRANGDETSSKSPRKAVPIHVRRAVLKRDEARCQARLHDGTICGSAVRIQFDHVVPDALGGPSTTDNGRILCAAHNREAARRVFGDEWIDLFARPGK